MEVPYALYHWVVENQTESYTGATPRTDRPSQSSGLLDLCTNTNQPQLADPGTALHGPLEYALGPHLQCYAYRMRLS